MTKGLTLYKPDRHIHSTREQQSALCVPVNFVDHMNYTAFENYLSTRFDRSFVKLTLKRIDEIEMAYGQDVNSLVLSDDTMDDALRKLECMIGKDDLDNYQNALHHYYKMLHGTPYPPLQHHIGFGNKRLHE